VCEGGKKKESQDFLFGKTKGESKEKEEE